MNKRMIRGFLQTQTLRLPRMATIITSKCTLKCSHCIDLNPLYKKREDFPAQRTISAIRRLLTAIEIEFIALMGGEPLLHPELPRIVRELREEPGLYKVSITTNGTIVPSEDLLDALDHPNTRVFISNYSEEIAPDMHKAYDALTSRGIEVRLAERDHIWADAGDAEPRRRSPDELRSMFSRCLYSECAAMLDGTLYLCPRNANAARIGILTKEEAGGIDLTGDVSELKARVIDALYLADYTACCDHCDYILPDGSQKSVGRAAQKQH